MYRGFMTHAEAEKWVEDNRDPYVALFASKRLKLAHAGACFFPPPPGAASAEEPIPPSNVGHALLVKNGWEGGGLGSHGQGERFRAPHCRPASEVEKRVGI